MVDTYETNHSRADRAIDVIRNVAVDLCHDGHQGDASDLQQAILDIREAIDVAEYNMETSDQEARLVDQELAQAREEIESLEFDQKTLESRVQYLTDSIASNLASHKLEVARMKREANKTAKLYSEAMSSELLT